MYEQQRAGIISSVNHNYDTRCRSNAVASFQRLSQCQRSLTLEDLSTGIQFQRLCVLAKSVKISKRLLKEHIVEKYEEE